MVFNNFTWVKMRVKVSKVFLIALLSFSFNTEISAQYYQEGNRLVGGLVAGANFTQVDGDGYRGYNNIMPSGGGILYMPMNDVGLPFAGTLAWSMEVLYNGKGAYGSGVYDFTSMTSQRITLHYAELPFQLNYWNGPRKSIYGMGFAVGYLGASEEKIETTSGQTYQFPFRKFDFSFLMTANFHVWRGFFLSPRFQYSLVSIRQKNAVPNSFGREEQFNNVLSVRLMYLFNVGSRY